MSRLPHKTGEISFTGNEGKHPQKQVVENVCLVRLYIVVFSAGEIRVLILSPYAVKRHTLTEVSELSGVYCGQVNLLFGVGLFAESVDNLVCNGVKVGNVNVLLCEKRIKVKHFAELQINVLIDKTFLINKIFVCDIVNIESPKLQLIHMKTGGEIKRCRKTVNERRYHIVRNGIRNIGKNTRQCADGRI